MEHLIKRYRNRKLYDTVLKRYIRLDDIDGMIHEGIEFRVIDNDSGEDITRRILTQIIIKRDAGAETVPVEGLKTWISTGETALRRVFQRTLDFGKNMAERVDIGLVPGINGDNRIDLDSALRGAEKLYEWTAGRVIGVVRTNLLNIPSRDDWEKLNKKMSDLEDKLSDLL